MFRLHAFAALAAALLLIPRLGAAVPVTASYDGTVTDHYVGFAPQIVSDLPLGTDVSWNFTFDDSFLADSVWDVFGTPLAASGSATIGTNAYTLTGMSLFSATFDPTLSEVLSYRFQVTGTGPALASGADFFGLWLSFDRALNLADPFVGFAYSSEFATSYGYGVTTGDYRLDRGVSVPEPSSLGLLGGALLLLGGMRRRRAAGRA